MPRATRRNNSMSQFNDIEASLRKKKKKLAKRQHVNYFLQTLRFTYNNKLITIPNNYCNLYYSTSGGPNTIKVFLYGTYKRQ